MTTWLTSDSHYGHANLIIYANRPYLQPGDTILDTGEGDNGVKYSKTVWANKNVKYTRAKEMTDDMVRRHNAKVKPDDRVIHLGDFAFGSTSYILQILRRLHGKYEFIWGNHDDNLRQVATIIDLYPDLKDRVKFLGDYKETSIEGQNVTLTHYAMRVWNGSHKGTWQLYGHSHGSLPDDPHAMNFDVGVDCHGLEPIDFATVRAIMAKKLWKPIDHHGSRQEGGGLGMTPEQYAKAERLKLYEQLQREFGK